MKKTDKDLCLQEAYILPQPQAKYITSVAIFLYLYQSVTMSLYRSPNQTSGFQHYLLNQITWKILEKQPHPSSISRDFALFGVEQINQNIQPGLGTTAADQIEIFEACDYAIHLVLSILNTQWAIDKCLLNCFVAVRRKGIGSPFTELLRSIVCMRPLENWGNFR